LAPPWSEGKDQVSENDDDDGDGDDGDGEMR